MLKKQIRKSALLVTSFFLFVSGIQDFPEDPTGNFGDLKDFIMENFQMCKWIGFSVMTTQVSLSCLLTTSLPQGGSTLELNARKV